MTIDQVKQLLQQYGMKPNETYGQNFLLNDIVLQDMVDSVPMKKGDAILEVGPGLGNLSRYLADTGHEVFSVEKDPKFLPVLKAIKKDYKNFDFTVDDILKFDFQSKLKSKKSYHVVANIPYYITGKIIQLFVQAKHKPKSITILIQKEVAENVTAKPGRLNLLAISVQLHGQAKLLQKVLARDFYPAPKVDSSVIQIILDERPKYEVDDEKRFFGLLRACFSGKRKQLHNTLTNYLQKPKDEVTKILESLKIDSAARPQELSIEEWVKLYKKVNE